jgi:hypothetical protein
MAFRVLWQWAHPAAGQDPQTKVLVTAVNDDEAFWQHCMVKAPVRMLRDQAQELLPPGVI